MNSSVNSLAEEAIRSQCDPGYPFLIDTFGAVSPSIVQDVAAFFVTHRDKFSSTRVAVVLKLDSKVVEAPGFELINAFQVNKLRAFMAYQFNETHRIGRTRYISGARFWVSPHCIDRLSDLQAVWLHGG